MTLTSSAARIRNEYLVSQLLILHKTMGYNAAWVQYFDFCQSDAAVGGRVIYIGEMRSAMIADHVQMAR